MSQNKRILYEPGPRHIELLAKSLDIPDNKKPSVTPGQKITYEETALSDSPEDIIASLYSVSSANAKVSFDPVAKNYSVTQYSEIFGTHPSSVFLTGPARPSSSHEVIPYWRMSKVM